MKQLFITCAYAAILATPAFARNNADIDAIVAANHRWGTAYATCDVKGWDELFTADSTYTHTSGKVDGKAATLDRMKDCHIDWVKTDPPNVRLYGTTAIVTGSLTIKPKGMDRVVATVYTRTYLKQNGAWRIAAHQSTVAPTAGQ